IGDAGVAREIVVLGPGIEGPPDPRDAAVMVPNRSRSGVARPDPVGGHDMQAHTAQVDGVRLEDAACILANVIVRTEYLDGFVRMKHAHDLTVDPWNGGEFPRPVGLVVWPRDPRRAVPRPFRGEAAADGSRRDAGFILGEPLGRLSRKGR